MAACLIKPRCGTCSERSPGQEVAEAMGKSPELGRLGGPRFLKGLSQENMSSLETLTFSCSFSLQIQELLSPSQNLKFPAPFFSTMDQLLACYAGQSSIYKPLSRRRLKLLKTGGFVMISGNFQWKKCGETPSDHT